MQKKVIVTVALTGGTKTKTDHPRLPESPEEIAEDAYQCYNEGAAIVHIHARRLNSTASDEPDDYNQIHDLIRGRCDIILQDTTGGSPGMSIDERLRSLEANPEMATLNMGSLVFELREGEFLHFDNTYQDISGFAHEMKARNIKPEIVLFNHSCLKELQRLIDDKLVRKPYFCTLPVGGGAQGLLPNSPEMLLSLIRFLPEESVFSTIVPESNPTELLAISIAMGGHVRVGFEDSIYLDNGNPADSNAQIVSNTVKLIRTLGYEATSPEEARKILGFG